jgi:redox-sensitive bicupin YhaK (pirin superfamily)
MSLTLRPSQARGHANHGWLDSYHTFSFAGYHDPNHMNFGALRVINEDRIQPGMGFGTHGHRDMEIISYVLDGELEHKDDIGNGAVIRPGDIQIMSAGTGIRHSEFNPSQVNPSHFLQIWLLPDREGHAPRYDQKHFTRADKINQLRLIASPDGRDGSGSIHQNALIYATILDAGRSVEHSIASGRKIWVQVMRGKVSVNGQELSAGDAAALDHEDRLTLASSDTPSECLVFDLA